MGNSLTDRAAKLRAERSDPEAVQRLAEKLLPEVDLRRALLEIFASGIERAHRANPASWSLTLGGAGDRLVFNVGRGLAFRLMANEVLIIADSRKLEEARKAEPALEAIENNPYKAVPGTGWLGFEPQTLAEHWPHLEDAYFAGVESATRVKRTPYFSSHSPGVLVFLEEVLDRPLPRPEHGEDAGRVTPAIARGLVDRLRRSFPQWDGFAHREFVDDEITYKQEAAAQAQQILARDELRELIAQEEFDEVLQRLKKVGYSLNLLYLGAPSSGDLAVLHAESLAKRTFCEAVFVLLHGEEESPARLDRFVRYLERHDLPNKWTFPTYYLFLLDPENEFFVKPGVTRSFLDLLDLRDLYSPVPSGEAYRTILQLVSELAEALAEYQPRDMIDMQSLLFAVHWKTDRLGPAKRREFETLFAEQVRAYLQVPAGAEHFERYREIRRRGRANFEAILEARRAGEDVTDRVLLELLPHADTDANREGGAWIHVAPAIRRNVKEWFEGAGWQRAEDWPAVAEAVFELLNRAAEDPGALSKACRNFASSPRSKGLQSGLLSPILNALRPEDYLLINNKSRLVINDLAGTSFKAKISDYPEANQAGLALLADFADVIEGATGHEEMVERADLFDMYCHWLVAVRQYPVGKPRYVKLSPGEGARLWPAWLKSGYAAVGWNELGDLKHADRADFERRRDAYLETVAGKESVVGLEQLWRFLQLREGDKVIANEGTRTVLGIGTVVGTYTFVADNEYGHQFPVEWHDTDVRKVEEPGWRRTLIELDEDKFKRILESETETKTESGSDPPPRNLHPALPLHEIARETGLDQGLLERWVRAIERKKQAVLYGPPGTGKTHVARLLARHLVAGGDGLVELVQFHPSTSYEDFIQGIRPTPDEKGRLAYPLREGRFLDFCRRAREREGLSVLIVDEINRAELSRVFGELMYLLEYRDEEIPLAAGGGLFGIPESIRLIGTMNTADRSIALVDHALRRRFAFLRLDPQHDVLRAAHRGTGFPVEALIEVLNEINCEIADPHYALGITFFLDPDLETLIEDVWHMEIEPYLEEFFFDRPQKTDAFRWPRVRERLK